MARSTWPAVMEAPASRKRVSKRRRRDSSAETSPRTTAGWTSSSSSRYRRSSRALGRPRRTGNWRRTRSRPAREAARWSKRVSSRSTRSARGRARTGEGGLILATGAAGSGRPYRYKPLPTKKNRAGSPGYRDPPTFPSIGTALPGRAAGRTGGPRGGGGPAPDRSPVELPCGARRDPYRDHRRVPRIPGGPPVPGMEPGSDLVGGGRPDDRRSAPREPSRRPGDPPGGGCPRERARGGLDPRAGGRQTAGGMAPQPGRGGPTAQPRVRAGAPHRVRRRRHRAAGPQPVPVLRTRQTGGLDGHGPLLAPRMARAGHQPGPRPDDTGLRL